MNRDYSYGRAVSPSFAHVNPETPDTVDYLLPICLLCFRPGDIVTAELDGFLTYVHPTCIPQPVDTESTV